jgi:DNA-directed RNA polymerase subunit K/omega
MGIRPIDLEFFNQEGKNVHESIVAASKRARQINEDLKIEFNQRVEMFATKTESETEENDINPDQLKVSLEFEKRPKPTDTAMGELLSTKLKWHYEVKEVPPPAKEEAVDESVEDGE